MLRFDLSRSHAAAALAFAAAFVVAGCGPSGTGSSTTQTQSFNVFSAGAQPPGTAVGSATILAQHSGIAVVNGPPFDALVPFDPTSGLVGASVTARVAVTFTPPLPDENGNPVTSTMTTFPSYAIAFNNKLYVTASNFDASGFFFRPGVVLVYNYDVNANAIGTVTAAIPMTVNGTSALDPVSIFAFQRSAQPTRIGVVCGDDAFATHPTRSAIIVIDPATNTIAESITLGAVAVGAGPVFLTNDLHLFIGSASAPQVYVVDMSVSPPAVIRGPQNPVLLGAQTNVAGFTAGLAASTDGSQLYALSFTGLSILNILNPSNPVLVTETAAFKRGIPNTSANTFTNAGQTLAVRPGRPGLDYSGADIALGVIGIAGAPPTAVDGISSYRTPVAITLNAVTAFNAGESIQQIVTTGIQPYQNLMFIVDGLHGHIVVRNFGAVFH